jgi:predicted phosphoadenosine phosphosulfate sulfurtransferase
MFSNNYIKKPTFRMNKKYLHDLCKVLPTTFNERYINNIHQKIIIFNNSTDTYIKTSDLQYYIKIEYF